MKYILYGCSKSKVHILIINMYISIYKYKIIIIIYHCIFSQEKFNNLTFYEILASQNLTKNNLF